MTTGEHPVPASWHSGMSETEHRKLLLDCIRKRYHMDFVVEHLESWDAAVEMLVNAACNSNESDQNREKFLRLIQRIDGSLSQSQMTRLSRISVHQPPGVRGLISWFLKENGYRSPTGDLLDQLEPKLHKALRSMKDCK